MRALKLPDDVRDSSDCSELGATHCSRLAELCREFIGYLEAEEESYSGRHFHPTTIQSCRCMVSARLGEIIPEIKSICENVKTETQP